MKILRSIWFQLSLALVLIVAGAILFNFRDSNAFLKSEPPAPPVAAKTWTPPKPNTIEGNPVQISIPSLSMDLPVINGEYNPNDGEWTLTLNKVQYAVNTPPPNNAGGNTFLYGHYRTEVFARLHDIQPGAQAIITTDNGHIFTYTYTGYTVVDPSDTSLFGYSGPPILTVQTCTGLFFQNRQLFNFTLTKVA